MIIPRDPLHAYVDTELLAMLLLLLAFLFPSDRGAAAAMGAITMACIGAVVLIVGCEEPGHAAHASDAMSLALVGNGGWIP